jgi:hypothetical protein
MSDDALCPECKRPADVVSGWGNWRFGCIPCEREWGHPQSMTYDEALDARAEAQGDAK